MNKKVLSPYIYNGMFFSHKQERTVICNNIAGMTWFENITLVVVSQDVMIEGWVTGTQGHRGLLWESREKRVV